MRASRATDPSIANTISHKNRAEHTNVHPRRALATGLLATAFAVSSFVFVSASALRAAETKTISANSKAAKNTSAERRIAHSTRLLSSDDFEGRGPGTMGIDRAADLIVDEFKQAGLNTAVFGDSPFQEFQITTSTKLGKKNALTLSGPVKKKPVTGETAKKESSKEPSNDKDAKKPAPTRRLQLEIEQEFNPLAIGGSGQFSLPLVFAGYGITAPEEDYDDYAGLDVKDKAVIVLRHEPQQDDPNGKFEGASHSEHAPFRRKVNNAYQHGAAAIIFCTSHPEIKRRVDAQRRRWQAAIKRLTDLEAKFQAIENPTDEQFEKHRREVDQITQRIANRSKQLQAEYDPVLDFQQAGRDNQGRSIPIVHCSRKVIDRALKASGHHDLATLEKGIDQGPTPNSFALEGWTASGEISVDRDGVPVKNVVAVLEGEGPLADETIVIGAHYDHLGRGGPASGAFGSEGEIHNGADDNASGTSALLEVARRLGGREKKLPRRVVFVAFTGEERGLLGSAEYVRNPPFPLDKTVAMLNLDMVGRMKDDQMVIGGVGTAKRFDAWLDELNEIANLKIIKNQTGHGPSDHATFYTKNIPVLFFFTGLHSDYHRPSDDFERVNIEGIRKITDLVVGMAEKIATEPKPPEYLEVTDRTITTRLGQEEKPKKPRPYFGCIPDYSQEVEGLAIKEVVPGGPAATAGIKAGDIVTQFGDRKIGGIEDFDLALRNHEPGETVKLTVQRSKKEIPLKIKLGKPKG